MLAVAAVGALPVVDSSPHKAGWSAAHIVAVGTFAGSDPRLAAE